MTGTGTGKPAPPAGATATPEDDETVSSLGSSLRELRKSRGLTLQQLADLCGLSQPFLSQLENGKAVPSLSALSAVAGALGTTAHGLLVPRASREVSTVRADEGARYDLVEGATVRFLVHGASRSMEPNEVTAEAGVRTSHTGHAGEEMVYVLEGAVRVELEGRDPIELGPGDTCTFPSAVPHSVGAGDAGPARYLIVSSPPSF